MQRIRRYPFYLLLLPLFFCLHGVIENYGAISFFEAIEIGLWISSFLIITFFILFLFSKSKLLSALITFFLWVLFLFFGAIKESLEYFPLLSSYKILLPSLLILLFITYYTLNNNLKIQIKLTVFFNILLLIYCSYDSVFLLYKIGFEKPHTIEPNFDFNYKAVRQRPNIYYLVFDEYAGYTSLKDSMGFKNDLFFESLKAKGFDYVPITANYFFTPFSMSSTINMQYLSRPDNNSIVTAKEIQRRTSEIKNGVVFKIFERMGYQIKNYSFFDILTSKNIGGDGFLIGHSRVLTNKTIFSKMFKDLGGNFMKKGNEIEFMQKLFLGDFPVYNQKVEKGLLNTIQTKSKLPQFVYAHFLMPHEPYLFDSSGVPNSLSSHFNLNKKNEPIAYLSYLKYCNKKIINYVDEIQKKDSNSIVVVMSDHGRKQYSNKTANSQAPFDNICFIKQIDKPLEKKIKIGSNVNFFRYLFNENFHQQIPLLIDSTFYLEDVIK